MRGLLTGKGWGFKQLRAAGKGVELSVLPKWSSSGQVSAKFSHESPASFCFLSTGGGLSLGPKMNSWGGMSSYYVYGSAYVIKITCCSYMKLYPNVVNRDFSLVFIELCMILKVDMLASYFVWGLNYYFIPNKTPIRIWSYLPNIHLVSNQVMHSQINGDYDFVIIWVVIFCLSFIYDS